MKSKIGKFAKYFIYVDNNIFRQTFSKTDGKVQSHIIISISNDFNWRVSDFNL